MVVRKNQCTVPTKIALVLFGISDNSIQAAPDLVLEIREKSSGRKGN